MKPQVRLTVGLFGILLFASHAPLRAADPATITLALAKINADDFVEITEAIGKRTKNVLDNP